MALRNLIECDHCKARAELDDQGMIPVGWYKLDGLAQAVEERQEPTGRDRLPGVEGEPRTEPPTKRGARVLVADGHFDRLDCLLDHLTLQGPA